MVMLGNPYDFPNPRGTATIIDSTVDELTEAIATYGPEVGKLDYDDGMNLSVIAHSMRTYVTITQQTWHHQVVSRDVLWDSPLLDGFR